MTGIVYALTNPAMEGLVKIGRTTRDGPEVRMNGLYTPGVPVPFECVIAVEVDSEKEIESALHTAFGPYRLNPRREFFEILPEQVEVLLRLLGKRDVTPEVNAENEQLDPESREAGKELSKRRRPRLKFEDIGVPIGAILVSVNNIEERAEVIDTEKGWVRFREEKMSFIQATRRMLGLEESRSVRPASYWMYEGRLLSDMYEDVYGTDNTR